MHWAKPYNCALARTFASFRLFFLIRFVMHFPCFLRLFLLTERKQGGGYYYIYFFNKKEIL